MTLPFPKPGDTVNVTLRNGEEVQGVIEWVDNNGAWVKGEKRSRWVPIEIIISPQPILKPKETRDAPPSLTEASRLERQSTKEEE